MSTRVGFTGIPEAREALRAQPQALAKATQVLAMRVARDAAADIKASYPTRSGRLRQGVTVQKGRGGGKYVAAAAVLNTNPIAHNFEHGTQARHTTHGINRGVMPAGNVFVPRIVRWRWVFFQSVKEIMDAAGITVTGDA
jgi:Bacteriophage HK97-gp10, putative tail-component